MHPRVDPPHAAGTGHCRGACQGPWHARSCGRRGQGVRAAQNRVPQRRHALSPGTLVLLPVSSMKLRARHLHSHASQPTVLRVSSFMVSSFSEGERALTSWAAGGVSKHAWLCSFLQFCTFGSRQIGRGYYVFDSRWNRLRCALNLMVEKHLNAQLWK